MKPLILNPSDSTPSVKFIPGENIFEISGESRPENTRAYYEPILFWIKELVDSVTDGKKVKPMVIRVELEYFSSTSAKYIANLFSQFEGLVKKGVDVKVLWRYRKEDTQIKDAGEQYQKILSIPFVFEIYQD